MHMDFEHVKDRVTSCTLGHRVLTTYFFGIDKLTTYAQGGLETSEPFAFM